jgi:OFA family oxalate/formate antiporter-like MFS transporter
LYTAKGAATVLIDLCNRLQAATGSWELVFGIMIAADWLAAILALAVLRPLRRRLAERGAEDVKRDVPAEVSSDAR